MKKLLTLSALVLSASYMVAQGFNGSIDFKYATLKDTTRNVYIVKDKKVRLDQYGKKNTNTVEGSFIFDMANNEIKLLMPRRKLWTPQKSETVKQIKGPCVVAKGTATKNIVGIKCSEYSVKNAVENIVITYWIADGKYTFFSPLVKMWNRPDKQSIYFSQIKNLPEGAMPLMSEERQLTDGKLLTKLEVTKITLSVPPESTFEIPTDYAPLK